ncbi:uncharacterized protein LOC106150420 [Lingula anatina]|uniref:Uncharacterized protein LOC106150420 n=1 Tax=Lingula anatina TaxID=7574 RepID=A0A1S3GY38_LINAN|nr:uncharacterized protein LOC106150420 [Lingula anatina]XP_013378668.1 uncharacterized protein LOC106150420 [Lingula anatina]XP_013378669.1 uncharacterized protein LOC106150420 [Lingula anatina]|eukprot:XP_013378667.1 uncharacterized protein LOC106150420 [Lingula anatina]
MTAAFTGSGHVYDSHAAPKIKRRLLASDEPSRHRRADQHQSDFDIRVSRVSPLDGDSKGSMLAYTERMQSIARNRGIAIHSGGNPGGSDSTLVVRAKHITRPRNLPKLSPRGQETLDSWSEESRPKKDALRVNTVSASDLRDLVDHSLYTKGTRRETVKLVAINDKISQIESRENSAKRSTNPKSIGGDDKHINEKASDETDTPLTIKGDSLSPVAPHWSVLERNKAQSVSPNNAKTPNSMFDVGIPSQPKINDKDYGRFTVLAERPKKVKIRKPPKRMKLHRSSLDSIPENETLSDIETSRPHSQVSVKMSPIVDLSEDHYPPTLQDHSNKHTVKSALSSIPEGTTLPQPPNSGFRSLYSTKLDQTKQVVNIKIIDSGESTLSLENNTEEMSPKSEGGSLSFPSSVDIQREQQLTSLRFNLSQTFTRKKPKPPSELSVKGAYLRTRFYEPKSKIKLPTFAKKKKRPKIRFLK